MFFFLVWGVKSPHPTQVSVIVNTFLWFTLAIRGFTTSLWTLLHVMFGLINYFVFSPCLKKKGQLIEETAGPEQYCPYLHCAFSDFSSCTYEHSSETIMHNSTHERAPEEQYWCFFQLCLFWGFLVFIIPPLSPPLMFSLYSSLQRESGLAFFRCTLKSWVPSDLLQIKEWTGKCFLFGKEQKPVNTMEQLSRFFSASLLQI